MKSHTIFTTAPFHLNDVPLGSLIPDIRYPNQDALIMNRVLEDEEFSKREQIKFHGTLDGDKQRKFSLQLTKLLRHSASKSRSQTLSLNAEKGWIYELKQPKALFKERCSNDSVRTWLREGLEEQQESYFVVGFRTFQGTAVGKVYKSAKELELASTIPVDDLVKANTSVSPSDGVNVEMNVQKSEHLDEDESFEVNEELVYAIEYRRIHMKKRDSTLPAALSKDNVWRYYSENRMVTEVGKEAPYEEYEALLAEDSLGIRDAADFVEDVDGSILLMLGETL